MTAGWLGPRSLDGGIDHIPLPDGVAGGLWLCGKHAIGPDPGAAMARASATTVVCLTERHELADRYPAYVDWLAAAVDAGSAIWTPIHDLHAPQLTAILPLLEELHARLDAGEVLLVHCAAGIGRAGTLAVCLLLGCGVSAEESLRTVAAHRPMAGPEVGAQQDLIDALAIHLAGDRTFPPAPLGAVRPCVQESGG